MPKKDMRKEYELIFKLLENSLYYPTYKLYKKNGGICCEETFYEMMKKIKSEKNLNKLKKTKKNTKTYMLYDVNYNEYVFEGTIDDIQEEFQRSRNCILRCIRNKFRLCNKYILVEKELNYE